MKLDRPFTALCLGAFVGGALFALIAAAPDPNVSHLPALSLNGKTNVISDNGTALTRDGVAIGGGGGDTIWTNNLISLDGLFTNTVISLKDQSWTLDIGNTNDYTANIPGLANVIGQFDISSDTQYSGIELWANIGGTNSINFWNVNTADRSGGSTNYGGANTVGLYFSHGVAATGQDVWRQGNGSYGIYGETHVFNPTVIPGAGVGVFGEADSAQSEIYGVIGYEPVSHDGQTNVAVAGILNPLTALTTGAHIAGLFFTGSVQPQLIDSVVLADNGELGYPLITGRNFGTNVFQVAASGAISSGATNQWKLGDYVSPGKVGVTVNATNYNLLTDTTTTPNIGAAKGTSLAVTNGVTAATVTGTNSGTFGSATINTNLTVNGQSGFAGFACANLPTGVAAGYQTYCTDCLTPVGTGDRVEWDGSAWRTIRTRLLATNDFTAYMLSGVSNVVSINTSLSCINSMPEFSNGTAFGGFQFATSVGGTGSSFALNGVTSSGVTFLAVPGTTTNGFASARSIFLPAMASGDFYESGARSGATADANGTDNYIEWLGFGGSSATNYPTDGFFFLRDRYNATGHGQSYTNDWICVTVKSSSYSFADSGLALSTSATALDKLKVIGTTASVKFLTNDVQAASIATTIPTVNLYAVHFEILKTLGTTSVNGYLQNPQYHIRWATARGY